MIKQRKSNWIKKFILATFVVTSCSPALASYFDEFHIEQNYETKLQRMVDHVYGNNQIVVQVSAKLGQESWRMDYTDRARVKAEKENHDGKQFNILPGYPVIKNLGPDELSKLPFNSRVSKIDAPILRLDIQLIVNKNFPREKLGDVTRLVTGAVDWNPKRGDKIQTKFEEFYAPDPSAQQPVLPKAVPRVSNSQESGFSHSNLWIITGLMIAMWLVSMLAVIFYLRKGFKNQEIRVPNINPSVSINPTIKSILEMDKMKDSGSGGPHQNRMRRFFDFVTEDNLDNIIHLLKIRALGLDQLTTIMAYLSPKVSAKLLSLLSIENQVSICSRLVNKEMLDRGTVDGLDNKVRTMMESLVGGESFMHTVFNLIAGQDRKRLLNSISQLNPAQFKAIRQKVYLFDDLAMLSDPELKMIVSEVSIEFLAVALVQIDQKTYQKIYLNLSNSAKAIVDQYIQLRGQITAPHEIEMAQNYVMDVVDKLDKEGRVQFRAKLAEVK